MQTNESALLDQARQIFAAQAFTTLIGAELVQFGDGTAEIAVPFRDELTQQNGFLHGGVLAYAVDNAVTFAAATALGPVILTSGISVTYLRPARDAIVARATVVGSTRRQAVVRCEVFCGDKLVASGQGTVAAIAE
jgi:uncharacterized protein (TIGR00369 family)